MTLILAIQWFSIAICWISVVVNVLMVRRWRWLAGQAHDTAGIALDMLDLMEQAHDPGRDVQNRLAAALEARLVVDNGPKVEPEARRAAAQMMAAQFILDIRRGGLVLSALDEPDGETAD